MAQNPLEVSMEVPITGIKYLVSAPIFVLFSPHTGSPHRVKKVLCHQTACKDKRHAGQGAFFSSPFILKLKFQFSVSWNQTVYSSMGTLSSISFQECGPQNIQWYYVEFMFLDIGNGANTFCTQQLGSFLRRG